MRVLVVDDEPSTVRSVAESVRSFGYNVDTAPDGASAWRLLQAEEISIVITDRTMPGMDGMELCRTIRDSNLPRYTYIIFLTSRKGREHVFEVLDAGADDFLGKPFDPQELRVRLLAGRRIVALERELRRTNEELRAVNLQLENATRIDSLMGIGNRFAFEEAVEAIHEGAMREGLRYGVIMCDIDRFKRCNDTYGHSVGDDVLRRVAAALKLSIRSTDRAYRYGGEEFVVLLSGQDLSGSYRVAERIRRQVESLEFEIEGGDLPYQATLSCGVAAFPDNSDGSQSWQRLVQTADQALYAAKRAGRNRVMTPQEAVESIQPAFDFA